MASLHSLTLQSTNNGSSSCSSCYYERMIKAVIFDYGGVITSGGNGYELAERLAANLQIPLERAKELVYAPWPDFMTGKINEAQYWQAVEEAYGGPVSTEDRQIWNTWEHMQPRPEMIAFANKLKSKGYTVGLLSNVAPVTEKVIRDQGGYELFQPCILSCTAGFAKPDRAIYDELLRQLPGIKPHEIIFVDDQQRYLDAAAVLGIQTVLAADAPQIIADVEALLKN